MSNQVYERITQEMISRLEKGTVPWHKPWKTGPAGFPMNLLTKARYRGINVFMLAIQSFLSPFWLTFKQALLLGGNVRKGEKATPVVFWKWMKTEVPSKEEGKSRIKRLSLLRYYQVFNAEQCEGISYPKPPTSAPSQVKSIAAAEKIVAGYPNGPRIEHQGDQAFYRPSEDVIYSPKWDRFEDMPAFYSTLFHELTHSTGHEKRLARQSLVDLCPLGSTNYSREELVAEMGAAMLSGEAGIENVTIQNSASYIAGWLKRLQDDRRLIVIAAAQAQKAVDHILGRSYQNDQPETPEQQPDQVTAA